ncbi:hypothetical protein [Psychrobacter sp. I-STPA6b]|uniref:hypothetical protein n=1 Tax=Psychrobacter sp. I-STPA6b TaxID=2585718 RepID=UPI001D0C6BF4|nr:hypothetical protein [Psychrobacter sp. I-STPA6b]
MRNNNESVKDSLIGFNAWLEDMPNAMQRFRNSLPIEVEKDLDFSLQSLNTLEKHLIATYENIQQLRALPNASRIADGYAIYIGETFRNVLKDYQPNLWKLMLEEDNVFYNLPVIEINGYTGCPLSLTTACIDRQKGDYWSNILLYVKKNI